MNHLLLHPHRICGYSESGITSMPRFFIPKIKTTDNPPFIKKDCFFCKKTIRKILIFLFFFMEEKNGFSSYSLSPRFLGRAGFEPA
jgi:hypothetical protein